MRKLYYLLISTLLLVGCHSPTKKDQERKLEKTPHDFMFMQRAYPSGKINTTATKEAIAWKNQIASNQRLIGQWELVGPTNIGGRITDIEVPLGQPNTYYVGAASGGVFKTTNAGGNWQPIFDEQGSLSIGDITISKTNSNTVWVGTGEVNAGGGSLAYDGNGIYKSTDGGVSWEQKGLPDVGSIGKIVLHPTNDAIIWVGAMGPLFKDDPNRGVYKSTDGGNTWQQTLFVSNTTGVVDMAIDPTNGDIVYAASWDRVRRPQFRQYGGEGSGLYKSVDGGVTWTEMTNGLPSAPSEKGRISIDIAESNPQVLYARYADAAGNIQGAYKTQDAGATWTTINSSQLTDAGFHWWFQGIVVDPTDENTIYNVDFEVQKSTNGGNSWSSAFPGVHVDQHAMAFNPGAPGQVLLGNDGGFYISNDDGASSVKDTSLPITQLYRMYVDPQNEDKIYAGAQDNSTMRTSTGSLDDWSIINGGDGFQPIVDFTNTNIIYALSQNGNLRKSTNNGVSFFNATNGIAASDRNNWDTPVEMSQNDPETLYYGTQRLYKTTDGAANWSAISPDLTNGPGGGNLNFGTITTIKAARGNEAIIYVGTDDGNVWVTQDGGENWENISSTLPNRWVTKVNTGLNQSGNEIFVTYSGYRFGEDSGHIYRSTDFGATWQDITGNLPDIPINDIEQTRYEGLFVATDVGVFQSQGSGPDWAPIGTLLPAVVTTDLFYNSSFELLYAATYGRSMYKISVNELGISENEAIAFDMYPNPASEAVTLSFSEEMARTITIYNTLGTRIHSEENSRMSFTIETSKLASGIYFVSISEGNKKAIKKLIIQ